MKIKSYEETWKDLNIEYWHKLENSAPNEEYRNEYTSFKMAAFVDRLDENGHGNAYVKRVCERVLMGVLEKPEYKNTLCYKRLKNSV